MRVLTLSLSLQVLRKGSQDTAHVADRVGEGFYLGATLAAFGYRVHMAVNAVNRVPDLGESPHGRSVEPAGSFAQWPPVGAEAR